MKKFISVLLSVVLLFSITAGIDLSAYALYDDITNAYVYSYGETYKGYMNRSNPKDYLSFNVPETGVVTINFKYYGDAYTVVYFGICNQDGIDIFSDKFKSDDYNSNLGCAYRTFSLTLNNGRYYFYNSSGNCDATVGDFEVLMNYQANVAIPSTLKVSTRKTTSLKLTWSKVNSNGYELQQYKSNKWTTIKTTTSTSYTVSKLKAGTTYKFRVRAYKTVGGKKYYSSWRTLTACTKPSTLAISSLKSNKSKQITVKWKKATCTGYQIQYSTSSSFKNAKTVTVSKSGTTSKTISKLKSKKKYYVRIRAYKTVDGKKYYGAWSKAMSVTTKK